MFLIKILFNKKGILFFLTGLIFASCTVVRNAPVNKPFVYSTKISVEGNISNDEKKKLTIGMENYWDDSLRAIKVNEVRIWFTHPHIGFVLKNPPTFDSSNVSRSKKAMTGYLNSQGYYYADIKDSISKFDTLKNKKQIRTSVFMKVHTGKIIRVDSVSYVMLDSSLQKIVNNNIGRTILKKGSPFNFQNVNSELVRLTSIFRDSGYYKFTKENLVAIIDTTDTKLLALTLDPIEQAKLIAEAAKNKKANPKWNILIEQKPEKDSLINSKFYVNKTFYFPETKLSDIPDSLMLDTSSFKQLQSKNTNLTMFYKQGKFTMRPLTNNTFIRKGNLYNETNFFKTVNTLGKIGSWQQTDARIKVVNKDSLDIYYFLVPAAKQSFSTDVEASRNSGDFISGSLYGLSTVFSYQNKNVWKQAIQSITSLSLGTELNLAYKYDTVSHSLWQSFQISLSHTYVFPRFIQPFKNWRYLNRFDNKKTLFSINGTYYDRKQYYRLQSVVTNWGYEWNKGANSWTWSFKPLNIELYKVDTLQGLIDQFVTYPFLRNYFRDGNVIGSTVQLSRIFVDKKNPNKTYNVRFYAEQSGLLINLIKSLNKNLFSYTKFEGEVIYSHKRPRSEIAARFFGGIGVSLNDQSIPTFKQYFLGGPNSMRAWNIRQLGLGSSISSDTIKSGGYTDRFGDMSLEANIEYRFNIATFSWGKIGSALFTDIGNIWNLKYNAQNPDATFHLSNLGKDIAIGVGTGLRFDFNYFLLRFDFGYKLKDPARPYNNGWVDVRNLSWQDTRVNGAQVNNWAFQFGINLPF